MHPLAVVQSFRRRVWLEVWAVRSLEAAGWLAAGWATAMVVARVLSLEWQGARIGPEPWHALLLVGAVVWGAIAGWRRRITAGEAAIALDRRMELGGLLVVAHEAAAAGLPWDAAWDAVLARRAEFAAEHLPRWNPTRAVRPAVAGGLFATVVLLLPSPGSAASLGTDPALVARVEGLRGMLGAMQALGVLDEPAAGLLDAGVDRLAGELHRAGGVDWGDLDGLAAQFARAQGQHAGRLDDLLGTLGSGLLQGAGELDGATLQRLAGLAQATGLLEDLPDAVQQGLRAVVDGELDGAALQGMAQGALGRAAAEGLLQEAARHVGALAGKGGEAPVLGRGIVDDLQEAVGAASRIFDSLGGGGLLGRGPGGRDVGGDPAVGAGRPPSRRALPPALGPEFPPAVASDATRIDAPDAVAPDDSVAWTAVVLPRHRDTIRRYFEAAATQPGTTQPGTTQVPKTPKDPR